MLLRKSDFSPAFAAGPASGGASDFYCAALDESDLTLTGEAESPSFAGGFEFLASTAYVYKSRADSDASWKRGTSAAGQKCIREGHVVRCKARAFVSSHSGRFRFRGSGSDQSCTARLRSERGFASTSTSSLSSSRGHRSRSSTERVSRPLPLLRSAGSRRSRPRVWPKRCAVETALGVRPQHLLSRQAARLEQRTLRP